MSWTFCTSGSAILKAGANRNTAIAASGSTLANWSDEAESVICDMARVDMITNYSSLTSSGKQILSELSSSMIAQKIISYDMSGYTKSEATLMMNVLENNIVKSAALIKEDKVKTYLAAT